MVHLWVGQKVTPITLIVRQNQPLKVKNPHKKHKNRTKSKKIRTRSTNDLKNTITILMEPPALPAAWIG
jgi:hypothetical protein